MLKKILIMSLCVMMAFSITGCGKESTQPIANDTKDEKEEVTLTFALWDTFQEPVLQEIISEFQKTNPHIKVDVQLTPFGQYWTKLETAATGGVLPDLFWMNGPNFIKYASNGMLLPIHEKAKTDNVDLTKYPKGLIELYTYENSLYGIPKDFDLTALWYNKNIFDDAGVPYPTDEWTWDDMVEAARKLTDKEKGIYGTSLQTSTQQGIYNTIHQSGGFVISPDRGKSGHDTPGGIKGIQLWRDLIEEGISPTIEELVDTPVIDLFESGSVAMVYAASWNVKRFMENENIKDNIDLVIMPMIDKRASIIHGLTNAINANTKHPEAAWELVKFLGSKEANEIWARSGVVIPAHFDALDIWINSYPQINLNAFVDQLDYSVMYPASRDNRWTEMERDTLRNVWSGEIAVEDACKTITQEMDKLLSQER
ncbi:ABC transporter substrate-binding protein [Alkaliphilus peptidifermentans]|uniref:Multiple sugar transport system substrate-binding protein n=1 Tax=Alkaliphilus peptidifermentans DSM 18978 TaxID=1120976 RepID=A0A1G5FY71_9FIRM|nr:sugar ABC transporter substrate-binding protein [Alkaliphilus peptidifermentans]SCY44101.1 multiple sugar transport system substrate-binding protein [Alkaliphilus peptidifermentans DSM 18978]